MRKVVAILKLVDEIHKRLTINSAVITDKNDIIKQQKDVIEQLKEQNEKLMDRLMARDFQQLKIYSEMPGMPEEPIGNYPEEELAGLAVDSIDLPIEGQD